MRAKVLVTGAGGFIGRELCRKVHDEGYALRALIRSGDKQWPDTVALDLTSSHWHCNPCDGVDLVLHLAGKAHALAESKQDADDYRRINTEAMRKLLEAAQQAGVSRFIFFSSVKAVGDSIEQPMDETVAALADTPYGQSKYEAEQLVLHGGYVPHSVVIRPCMVYGNTDKGNLPRMIRAIRKGVFPPMPEVHNKRSMVHVEDLVRAALLAADNPAAAGQVYIVSDGKPYSTREIYDWIRSALGKAPAPVTMSLVWLRGLAKAGDVIGKIRGRRFLFDSDALAKLIGSAWYTSAKIERELGFEPVHDLSGSLPEIVRFLEKFQA